MSFFQFSYASTPIMVTVMPSVIQPSPFSTGKVSCKNLIALYAAEPTLKASTDALNAINAFARFSIPLATSSGWILSIQSARWSRKLFSVSLFRKFAVRLDSFSRKISSPSPTVSANGSSRSQKSDKFCRICAQFTLSLNSFRIRRRSGSPFSIVHSPSGKSTCT